MTAKAAANWMLDELRRSRYLDQDHAAAELERRFGQTAFYTNDAGNLAIRRDVLAEFRALTSDVVWDREERQWRFREAGDANSRLAE